MGKTVVVYQSKYGAAKRYAQWIAEELTCDLYERRTVKADDLAEYDTVIYGGGLYAGGVNGIDLLTKSLDKFDGKNLILFTCGLADPADADNICQIGTGIKNAMPSALLAHTKVFHLRGGINYGKLTVVHRAMMAMMHKMVQKKHPDTLRADDRGILETYGGAVDFTDRAAIEPIISYLRGL